MWRRQRCGQDSHLPGASGRHQFWMRYDARIFMRVERTCIKKNKKKVNNVVDRILLDV